MNSKDWRAANGELAAAYGTYVPDYDLTPVLNLLSGIDPAIMKDAMTRCIMMLTDQLLMNAANIDRDSRDLMYTLKKIWAAFNAVSYDQSEFDRVMGKQIGNNEGIFCNEPATQYPIG